MQIQKEIAVSVGVHGGSRVILKGKEEEAAFLLMRSFLSAGRFHGCSHPAEQVGTNPDIPLTVI